MPADEKRDTQRHYGQAHNKSSFEGLLMRVQMLNTLHRGAMDRGVMNVSLRACGIFASIKITMCRGATASCTLSVRLQA